jgi:colanic acid/amylovoran biosynthesis protein
MGNILINNVYSYRNRGDSAIVEAMGAFINTHFPGDEVRLLSQFWQENQSYYECFGFESFPQFFDVPMEKNKLKRLLLAARSFSGTLSTDKKNSFFCNTKAILDAGGGSLFSSNKYWFYLGLYQHLLNLWIGKKNEIPVVIFPQSIGPFNKAADRYFVGRVLKQLDLVLVRERISSSLLSEMGVKHQLVPDIAFLANFIREPSQRVVQFRSTLTTSRTKVGVTVLNWGWAVDSKRGTSPVNDYLEKIAATCKRLNRQTPLHAYIFPQVTASFGDSDLPPSQRLHSLLGSEVPATIVDFDASASDLCHLYREMDIFLGSRMHSCIFAISQGVPTIGLAYQPKTIGTFELVGLDKFAFDIRGWSVDTLHRTMSGILADRGDARRLFSRSAKWAKEEIEATLLKKLVPILGAAN